MGLGSLGKIVGIANPAMGLAIGTAGGFFDRSESRHSAKQQYTYNSWLQAQNEAFQKEMAQNAHQWEVQDLEKAGLNPIISAQGSTAGSIAGSSAPQGTSGGNASEAMSRGITNLSNLITATSGQHLNEKLGEKAQQEALESAERTKNITPQTKAEIAKKRSETLKNTAALGEIESAIKLKQAEEALKNEETKRTKKGVSGYTFGTDPSIKDTALNLGILGAGALGLGMSSAKDFASGAIRKAITKHYQNKYGSKGYNFGNY